MTWPLAAGLTRDVPGDLGDSLLNMWILGWGAESLPKLFTGAMSVRDVWNANIFHPEPLALAFSEHLFGQVVQILPIYHLTGNLILCYNLLFLSTYVLAGLGMYLLARDLLTEGRRDLHGAGSEPAAVAVAAFLAGLIYAFLPYRLAQLPHIQILSSQWMPFALYGFRRAILAGPGWRPTGMPLAGGTAALLMQNWSCGYYLIYFAPLVPLFVLHQMVAAGRWRDGKLWLGLTLAALVVTAGTVPFLALYLEARRVHGFERPIGEVIQFSADVYSYLTAPEDLRLWGSVLRVWPKPEGELFLGFTTMALAVVAILAPLKLGLAKRHAGPSASSVTQTARWRTAAATILGLLALVLTGSLIGIIFTGGFITSFFGIPFRATNAPRLFWQIAILLAAVLAVSPRFRGTAGNFVRSPTGMAAIGAVLAVWLSLGPLPQSRGIVLSGRGLYGWFFAHVPGFDGLRAPARYAMIAGVFLSLLAGIGAAVLLRRVTRPAMIGAILCVILLVEAAFVPMRLNQSYEVAGVALPPRVEPASSAPAIYHHLTSLPRDAVIAEFPMGDPGWELRYVYYSTVHWRRLVNGYSGGFPQGYKIRVARLERISENPEEAWRALRDAGTTHVVVHESAYPPGAADLVKTWLTTRGAREVGRFDSDLLYELPMTRPIAPSS